MNNILGNKKIIYAFVIIGAVAVIAIILVGLGQKGKTPTDTTNPDAPVVTKNDVDFAQLPDKFPSELPQEPGAVILKNETQTATDGRFQATRVYVTSKPIAENFRLFQAYFQEQGWIVTATVEEVPNYRSISASKGNTNMQVSITDNQVSNQKTVDINLSQTVEPK